MAKPENKSTNGNKNPSKTVTAPESPKTDAAPAGDTAAAVTTAPTGGKAKKAKKVRVRLASTTIPGLWCRMFKDVLDKHGAPYDANGAVFVVSATPVGGFKAKSPEEKAAAKKAKEDAKAAEAAKLAGMSEEEKLAYAKASRDQRAAAKAAKDKAARDKLIEELRAEIAAGRL